MSDIIKGSVKIVAPIDRVCIKTWQELLTELERVLGVVLPEGAKGVIFSNTQPSEDDRDKLWVYRDNSGSILGMYAFQGGQWRPLYLPVDQEIRWFFGDSDNPPAGWQPILSGDNLLPGGVPASVEAAILAQSVLIPPSLTRYAYYAARYIGF
jgi:hypothetical protein